MQNVRPDTSTISTLMIASVIGRVIVIFVPMPTSLVMSTTPPSLAMFVCTMSMPTPRPERLVASSRVVKPGWKTSVSTSLVLISRASASVTSPRLSAAAMMTAGSIPLPSSSTSMTTWLPFWNAFSAIVPTGGFWTRIRSSRSSMP